MLQIPETVNKITLNQIWRYCRKCVRLKVILCSGRWASSRQNLRAYMGIYL